jgi:pre-mRNA-splicing factor 18
MVGIHERSGREKISTSKVAHVMNNEAQRKYFTSVKRLMSYAQQKRPDVPPSMKVL